jgi:hypothetical protein
LYWTEFSLTAVLAASLVFLYAHRKAPLYARLLTFGSFFCSLLCFAILPIDIYQST